MSDDQLLDLVDKIYAGATDDARWLDALTRIADTLGAAAGGFGIQDMATHAFSGAASIRMDPEYTRSYRERFAAHNPVWERMAATAAPGSVLTDRMVLPKPEFLRSAIYNEWFRPQGLHAVMTARVIKEASRSGVIVLFRSDLAGDFTEDQVRTYKVLVPHLERAVQIRLRLAAADLQRRSLTEALDQLPEGVILVDADGAVLFANRTAEDILHQGDGLWRGRAGLACDDHAQTHALHGLIASAASPPDGGAAGGFFAVRRRSGRRPLSVLVAPLHADAPLPLSPRPAAIVFVRDPERVKPASPAELRALYDLTPAEVTTALAVFDATSLSEAADRLGVSLATVRTHLQHVFEKTGISRQAQLAQLLLASGNRARQG